jgi:AcrR family transcriptional regulator
MARKSNELDKKMIAAGVELILEGGIAKLSTRDIAERAGANLGMFNYHFGTKEKFVLKLLNEFYKEFLENLDPLNNEEPHLEAVLFQIAVFSRDSRKLLTSILSDVLSNDEVVVRFLKKNFSEHFAVLEQTLKAHLKIKKLSTPNINHAIRFLIGAVGVPNILFEVSILSDVLSNDEVVVRFLKKNFSEHFAVLEQTLKAHLKIKKLSTPNINHAIRFLIGAVGVPNILFEVYERGGRKKHSPDSDNELKSRVKAAIIGLESGLCDKTK